jgi:hypothetical protein
MFEEIEGAYVTLVRAGVYTRATVYLGERDSLYGQLSKNRYVALHRDHYTSSPTIMWRDITGVTHQVNQKLGAITLR